MSVVRRGSVNNLLKRHLLLNHWMDFEIILQECSLGDPLPNCLNGFALLNKMAARAKNRKNLKTTSSPWPLTQFQNNFTGMFLGWPSTKFVQTIPLGWTRWPPELKIEKPLNVFSFVINLLKRHLLNQRTDFEIILQECSLGDPLPKLPKWFSPLNKMAARGKNRKTLKWHRQGYTLGDPLPKLLKLFCSDEQDGCQS